MVHHKDPLSFAAPLTAVSRRFSFRLTTAAATLWRWRLGQIFLPIAIELLFARRAAENS
jgi:hypothetical protein